MFLKMIGYIVLINSSEAVMDTMWCSSYMHYLSSKCKLTMEYNIRPKVGRKTLLVIANWMEWTIFWYVKKNILSGRCMEIQSSLWGTAYMQIRSIENNQNTFLTAIQQTALKFFLVTEKKRCWFRMSGEIKLNLE